MSKALNKTFHKVTLVIALENYVDEIQALDVVLDSIDAEDYSIIGYDAVPIDIINNKIKKRGKSHEQKA